MRILFICAQSWDAACRIARAVEQGTLPDPDGDLTNPLVAERRCFMINATHTRPGDEHHVFGVQITKIVTQDHITYDCRRVR